MGRLRQTLIRPHVEILIVKALFFLFEEYVGAKRTTNLIEIITNP